MIYKKTQKKNNNKKRRKINTHKTTFPHLIKSLSIAQVYEFGVVICTWRCILTADQTLTPLYWFINKKVQCTSARQAIITRYVTVLLWFCFYVKSAEVKCSINVIPLNECSTSDMMICLADPVL